VVEQFACKDQWLKIAGGAKSCLVRNGLPPPPHRGLRLELGLFVGYSAIRLASEGLVASVESDISHVCVASRLV